MRVPLLVLAVGALGAGAARLEDYLQRPKPRPPGRWAGAPSGPEDAGQFGRRRWRWTVDSFDEDRGRVFLSYDAILQPEVSSLDFDDNVRWVLCDEHHRTARAYERTRTTAMADARERAAAQRRRREAGAEATEEEGAWGDGGDAEGRDAEKGDDEERDDPEEGPGVMTLVVRSADALTGTVGTASIVVGGPQWKCNGFADSVGRVVGQPFYRRVLAVHVVGEHLVRLLTAPVSTQECFVAVRARYRAWRPRNGSTEHLRNLDPRLTTPVEPLLDDEGEPRTGPFRGSGAASRRMLRTGSKGQRGRRRAAQDRGQLDPVASAMELPGMGAGMAETQGVATADEPAPAPARAPRARPDREGRARFTRLGAELERVGLSAEAGAGAQAQAQARARAERTLDAIAVREQAKLSRRFVFRCGADGAEASAAPNGTEVVVLSSDGGATAGASAACDAMRHSNSTTERAEALQLMGVEALKALRISPEQQRRDAALRQARLLMAFRAARTTMETKAEMQVATERIQRLEEDVHGEVDCEEDDEKECNAAGHVHAQEPLLAFNYPNTEPIFLLRATGEMRPLDKVYSGLSGDLRRKATFTLEIEVLGAAKFTPVPSVDVPVPDWVIAMCPGAGPLPVKGNNEEFEKEQGLQRVQRTEGGRTYNTYVENAGANDKPISASGGSTKPVGCELEVELECKRCYAWFDADVDLDFQWQPWWGGHDFFHLDFAGQLETEMRLAVTIHYGFKYQVAGGDDAGIGGSLISFSFFVGPLPITVSPTWHIGFLLEVLVGGSIQFDVGFKARKDLSMKLDYDSENEKGFQFKTASGAKSGLDPIFDFNAAEVFIELTPTITLALGAEVGIGMKHATAVDCHIKAVVPLELNFKFSLVYAKDYDGCTDGKDYVWCLCLTSDFRWWLTPEVTVDSIFTDEVTFNNEEYSVMLPGSNTAIFDPMCWTAQCSKLKGLKPAPEDEECIEAPFKVTVERGSGKCNSDGVIFYIVNKDEVTEEKGRIAYEGGITLKEAGEYEIKAVVTNFLLRDSQPVSAKYTVKATGECKKEEEEEDPPEEEEEEKEEEPPTEEPEKKEEEPAESKPPPKEEPAGGGGGGGGGGSDLDFWWVKNPPWWMPAPPSWGAAPPTVYDSFYSPAQAPVPGAGPSSIPRPG